MALLHRETAMQIGATNVHKRNANGETPLHVAAIRVSLISASQLDHLTQQGKYELCKMLLEQGAVAATRDNAGYAMPQHHPTYRERSPAL